MENSGFTISYSAAKKIAAWLIPLLISAAAGYVNQRFDGIERKQEMILNVLMDHHNVGPQPEGRYEDPDTSSTDPDGR